jgi:ethylene-responsive transcription factor 1
MYRGVYETSWGGRWWASIKKDGKSRYLGVFPDAESAARRYDQAALSLHGDKAKLNFPLEEVLEGSGVVGVL